LANVRKQKASAGVLKVSSTFVFIWWREWICNGLYRILNKL